jgi:hypothetical protein
MCVCLIQEAAQALKNRFSASIVCIRAGLLLDVFAGVGLRRRDNGST